MSSEGTCKKCGASWTCAMGKALTCTCRPITFRMRKSGLFDEDEIDMVREALKKAGRR